MADSLCLRVSVVIPTWNGRALLEKNLPSVLKAVSRYADSSEVIVVDDGGSDGSAEFVRDNFPSVKLLRHSKNQGFRSAIRTGVESAQGEVVVLLNNDVWVTEDFLDQLLPHFDRADVFQVSCLSLLEDRKTIGEGPKVPVFRRGLLKFEKLGETWNGKPIRSLSVALPTFFGSGGQSAVRKDMFLALGGFDPMYDPFYWEDVDLSYRAWKRGGEVLFEPRSVVVHGRGSTINAAQKKSFNERIKRRNRLLFIWKNITSRSFFIRRHLLPLLVRLLFGFLVLDFGFYRDFFAALSRLPAVLRSRRTERAEERVSDEGVWKRLAGMG